MGSYLISILYTALNVLKIVLDCLPAAVRDIRRFQCVRLKYKKVSNIGRGKGWLVGQITWVKNGAVRVAEKPSTFLPCKEV